MKWNLRIRIFRGQSEFHFQELEKAKLEGIAQRHLCVDLVGFGLDVPGQLGPKTAITDRGYRRGWCEVIGSLVRPF